MNTNANSIHPYQLCYVGVASIIPTAGTLDDLVNLGYGNLSAILHFCRQQERQLRSAETPFSVATISSLAVVRDKIAIVQSCMKKAEDKPVFPSLRNRGYFPKGARVIGFIGDAYNLERLVPQIWAEGVIESGWEAIQYSVRFNQPVLKKEQPNIIGWWDRGHAQLLFEKELEYLLTHPSYFGIWIHNCGTRYECRVPSGMYRAIFEGGTPDIAR